MLHIRGFALITLIHFLIAGCDLSGPLTPVSAIQSPVLQSHADSEVWASADDQTKQRVWREAQAEFQRTRSAQDFTALLRLAREVHHLFPEERKAWLDLSTALLIMGDFGKSLTAANGALDDARREDFAPDADGALQPQAWCNIASAQIELAQHPEALEAADQAIAVREDFAPGHLRRGEALRALGRLEEAVASCQRAFALEPRVPDVVSSDHITCALAQRDLGDLDGAEATLRSGIAQMPSAFGLHHHLGLVLQRQGRLEDAFFEHSHELDLRVDTPYGRRVVGDLGALAQTALENPDDPAFERLGRIIEAKRLADAGRVEEAIPLWRELLEGRPDGDAAIFLPLRIAQAMRGLGRGEEAEQWHRQVLERDPQFVPSLVEIAEIQEERGEVEAALATLRLAQERDPRCWRLLSHIETHPGRLEILSASASPGDTTLDE